MDSVEVFRSTLDGLPYGVTLWRAESDDPDDLRLVYANAQASKEAGLDLSGILGKRTGQLFRTDSHHQLEAARQELTDLGMTAALASTPHNIPRYEYRDAQGATHYFRVHLVPVWDRTVALIYKQDSPGEELEPVAPAPPRHAVRDYFEDVVRTLREPLAVLDDALCVRWANDIFATRFGLMPDSSDPRTLENLVVNLSASQLQQRLGLVVKEQVSLSDLELEFRHANGAVCSYLANARPLNTRRSTPPLMLLALEDITEQRRHEATRRKYIERLVRTRDEERRAIARDLHDHVGQVLTTFTVHLQRLQNAPDEEQIRRQATNLQTMVEQLMGDISQLAAQLHPYRLEQLGFEAAIRELTQEFSQTHRLPVEVVITGFEAADRRLESEIEIGLFRIIQEALTNVARHAKATTVSVVVHRTPEHLRALVEDDGCGFDPELNNTDEAKARLGLVALEERATLLGGGLTVDSDLGRGTAVSVTIPLSSPHRDV